MYYNNLGWTKHSFELEGSLFGATSLRNGTYDHIPRLSVPCAVDIIAHCKMALLITTTMALVVGVDVIVTDSGKTGIYGFVSLTLPILSILNIRRL